MALGGPCPGFCNTQWRKAQAAFTEALKAYDPLDAGQSRPLPPEIRAWPGDPIWCGRCASRIRQCLAELDDAAAILLASADGHRPASGEQRVSGSQEEPGPSPAGDDLEELASMVRGWEESYRSLKGWPSEPRRGFLASTVTTCAAWLGSHLDGILSASDIAEAFGSEIMQWHREFVAKAKAGVRRLKKPMRCPDCHLLTLLWTEGEQHVQCANRECGRVMLLSEYESQVSAKAGEARATPAA